MSLLIDLQKQNGGKWVEFYALDLTDLGGSVITFHSGVNQLNQPVVWQGVTYEAHPIRVTGFEVSGKSLARPKMSVSNIEGLITELLRGQQVLGGKLIRKRTMVKFLDAVNFVGGINPEADPNTHLRDEVYFVTQKLREDLEIIEFELGVPMDLEDVVIPRRPIVANVCAWPRYRGEGCGYAGPPVADRFDNPTTDPALDACSKKTSGCKLRFGEYGELPMGAFPAAGLTR